MTRSTRLTFAICLLLCGSAATAQDIKATQSNVVPHSPDWLCATETASFSLVALTNEGLIDQNKIDNSKTEIQLLLKKPLGGGRFAAVYHVVLHQYDGKSIAIIVTTDMAQGQCPADRMTTYVVSKELSN